MPIDVRLLKSFLATAERLSFTKAADDLSVSQPRLSLLIRKLEDQLGFALFVRAPHHVRLTNEGAQFLEHARELNSALKHFGESVLDLRGDVRSRLRLGSPVTTTVAYPDRFDLIDEFASRHKTIRLIIDGGFSNVLVQRLREGKLDLTFAMTPFDPPGLVSLQLATSTAYLAIPQEHALARHARVSLDMLNGVKVATIQKSAGTTYRLLSNTMLRQAGAILVGAYEPHGSSLMQYAARKRLCTITHVWHGQKLKPNNEYPDLVLRPLVGVDVSQRVHLLKTAGPQPPAVEWFWRLAKRHAEANGAEAIETAHERA